jgi:hypothetical protein
MRDPDDGDEDNLQREDADFRAGNTSPMFEVVAEWVFDPATDQLVATTDEIELPDPDATHEERKIAEYERRNPAA